MLQGTSVILALNNAYPIDLSEVLSVADWLC